MYEGIPNPWAKQESLRKVLEVYSSVLVVLSYLKLNRVAFDTFLYLITEPC